MRAEPMSFRTSNMTTDDFETKPREPAGWTTARKPPLAPSVPEGLASLGPIQAVDSAAPAEVTA
jgi:hypothetical protein